MLGNPFSATVRVNDDDSDTPPPPPEPVEPGLVPSTVSLAVLRGGAGSFSLKLDTAPTATVTVTVAVSDGNGWTVDTDPGSAGKQTTLLFSPANWNQPQEVVVSAGQEASPCGSAPITVSNAQLSLQDQSASKMADFDEGFFGSPGRGAASPPEKLGGSMQKPFRTEFPMLRGHSMGEVVRFS